MTWSFDLGWWISVVELPVLAGLFWLIHHQRHQLEQQLADIAEFARSEAAAARAALAEFKLDVARNYASIQTLKDVELRLTEHLIRIESKLDRAHKEN